MSKPRHTAAISSVFVCGISIRSLLGTEYGEGGPKPNGAEVHLCPQKKQGHSLYCEMLLNLNRFISTIHHDGVEENLFSLSSSLHLHLRFFSVCLHAVVFSLTETLELRDGVT